GGPPRDPIRRGVGDRFGDRRLAASGGREIPLGCAGPHAHGLRHRGLRLGGARAQPRQPGRRLRRDAGRREVMETPMNENLPLPALIRPCPFRAMAQQEFLVMLRTRWVGGFGLLFLGLVSGFSWFGTADLGLGGIQDFSRTCATLVNLVCTVLPL